MEGAAPEREVPEVSWLKLDQDVRIPEVLSVDLPRLVAQFYEHTCPWCAPRARYPASCYAFPVSPSSMHGLRSRGETDRFRDEVRMHVQACNFQAPVSWKSSVPVNVVTGSLLAAPNVRGKVPRPRVRKVCVGILFVRPLGSPDQDVDNNAKAFLDAIKGSDGLIADDMEIVHLECFKVESQADFELTMPCGHRNLDGLVEQITVSASSFTAIRIQLI